MQIKASLHKKGRFFYSILPSFEACSFKRGGFAGQYARTKPSAIFARRQRHTKSLSCIKPPGKAGRFDETTRRSAGGFCFMPRGARFGAGRRANWAAKQDPALRTESGGAAFYSSCKSFDQPSLSNAKNSRLISMATMAASVMPDRATLPSDSVTPDRPTTKTTEVRTMLRFLL